MRQGEMKENTNNIMCLMQIQRDGCIHRLCVNKASCMDAGEIHLIAQNQHGTVSHSCKLVLLNKKNARQFPLEPDQTWTNVEDVNVMSLNNQSRQEIETGGNLPASIMSGPQSVTVLRGESVTLQAHVAGDPPPLVTWFKGVSLFSYLSTLILNL